jgi:hypothetical protein
VSTTPLTLPTVEELLEAFPMATDVTTYGGRVAFTLGRTEFFLRTEPLAYRCYAAEDGYCGDCGRGGGDALRGTWRQSIDDCVADYKASKLGDIEVAQAAIAALDEAMKETTNG